MLARLRADPVVAGFGRDPIDQHATSEQLEHIAALIPTEWSAAAAEGSGLHAQLPRGTNSISGSTG